jgi:hypothetical protein
MMAVSQQSVDLTDIVRNHFHSRITPPSPDNYSAIALMNNFLKLWTVIIKDAGSEYAETTGILCEQQYYLVESWKHVQCGR